MIQLLRTSGWHHMSPQCGNMKQWPCPPRATMRNATSPPFQNPGNFPLLLVKHEISCKALAVFTALRLLSISSTFWSTLPGALSALPQWAFRPSHCHDYSLLRTYSSLSCLISIFILRSTGQPSLPQEIFPYLGSVQIPLLHVREHQMLPWECFYIMFDSLINFLSPLRGDKLQENRDLLVFLTIECGAHRGPGTSVSPSTTIC